MRIRGILAFVLATAAAGTAADLIESAPARATARRNPLAGNARAQRAGAKLYSQECASCHGARREGRNAPPLHGADVEDASPGAVFWVITNGSLSRGMPSFAHLPEARRWQIVTFLQSGSTTGPSPHAR